MRNCENCINNDKKCRTMTARPKTLFCWMDIDMALKAENDILNNPKATYTILTEARNNIRVLNKKSKGTSQ